LKCKRHHYDKTTSGSPLCHTAAEPKAEEWQEDDDDDDDDDDDEEEVKRVEEVDYEMGGPLLFACIWWQNVSIPFLMASHASNTHRWIV